MTEEEGLKATMADGAAARVNTIGINFMVVLL